MASSGFAIYLLYKYIIYKGCFGQPLLCLYDVLYCGPAAAGLIYMIKFLYIKCNDSSWELSTATH